MQIFLQCLSRLTAHAIALARTAYWARLQHYNTAAVAHTSTSMTHIHHPATQHAQHSSVKTEHSTAQRTPGPQALSSRQHHMYITQHKQLLEVLQIKCTQIGEWYQSTRATVPTNSQSHISLTLSANFCFVSTNAHHTAPSRQLAAQGKTGNSSKSSSTPEIVVSTWSPYLASLPLDRPVRAQYASLFCF